MRRPCATVSIDWLIKSCYQDGGRPVQPAAFRDVPCCVWVNKVMCSLSGCNTAGVVAMWWLHYRRHFDCQSKRLGPNAFQCDEEDPGKEKVPHLPWSHFPRAWTTVCAAILCISAVFSQLTNRETANRKVRTSATCPHSHERGCLECGLCVGRSWGGSTPRQKVWERRQEISLCDTKLFIDTGEAEMDPSGSLCLAVALYQLVSVMGDVLYILYPISRNFYISI